MSVATVYEVYEKLLNHFGEQKWWLGFTPFEVVVGTILAQHTKWNNASRALKNLRESGLLEPSILAHAISEHVIELISPAGLQRRKASTIANISKYLTNHHQGRTDDFFNEPSQRIREEILAVGGVGRETADSILLYAADKMILPVDKYTSRLCTRFGLIDSKYCYERLRIQLEGALPKSLKVLKEFRALIVELGKAYCKKNNPRCHLCPLENCRFRQQHHWEPKGVLMRAQESVVCRRG